MTWYDVLMKPTTYKIIPDFISTTKGIIDVMLQSHLDPEEMDINLTLLGASTLDSKSLTEAIKSKTFPVGSHVMVRCEHIPVPFKILAYNDDGTAFCQSMVCLGGDRVFSKNESNDYLSSDIRKYLQSPKFMSAFDSDFKKNHLLERTFSVEKYDDPDRLHDFNDRFVLLDMKELYTYCPTASSRIRYFFSKNSRGEFEGSAASWWLRNPYTGYSGSEYSVLTSGASNYYYAYYSGGCAPACTLG